jgi:hypothetical protein
VSFTVHVLLLDYSCHFVCSCDAELLLRPLLSEGPKNVEGMADDIVSGCTIH